MSGAEAFELKHETASIHSMDSAYQSQSSASRRGTTLPEGYSEDSRSRMNRQFPGSDIYSPSLSSDTLGAFPEHQSDMSHMQLPSAANEMDAGDNTFAYANYTTGQDFAQYTATSIPRFQPASAIDMAFSWGVTDSQPYSLDASMYSNPDPSELFFNTPAPIQRQVSRPRVDTSVRPTGLHSTFSYGSAHSARRPSAQTANFSSYITSPASSIHAQLPSAASPEFEHQLFSEPRNDKEDTTSTSLAPLSINDEDEMLSASDAAEARTMEEEQGKVARSHPLYQAQPDENGKYHCPNEGKPGCNHKPTTLKCNYDKFVDSHLKPFRCNKKVCVGVQFSSTACLLRHEREAHGMHGHGSRPHLCLFAECERSLPGNGFPRRYNLFDHMKRVHDYTGPTTEPSPPVQPAQPSTTRSKGAPRKRKSTAEEVGEKRQKVAKPTLQQQQQQRRSQLQEAFLSKKQHLIEVLSNLGGPNDLGDDIQLTKEVMGLHDISAEFKRNLGG